VRRSRAAFAVLLGFLAPLPLAAQFAVKDLRFVPPTFFVGDPVEMHIVFDADDAPVLDVPTEWPAADWVEIRDIAVRTGGEDITVVVAFTPFAPGTRSLPTIDLGGMLLQDLKVPTHSLLENDHPGRRSLRAQLLLPGTRLAVALILTLAAMAPFLGYGLTRAFWTWFRQVRELYRAGRPARRFRRLLGRLRSRVGAESASRWFSDLTEGLRDYMSARTGRDCRSSTTAEIGDMPEFGVAESPQGRLLDVLRDGDMVKFAGRVADDRRLAATLSDVERAVAEWEKGHVQHQ